MVDDAKQFQALKSEPVSGEFTTITVSVSNVFSTKYRRFRAHCFVCADRVICQYVDRCTEEELLTRAMK